MKNRLSLLLLGIALFSAAGCGSGDTPSTPKDAKSSIAQGGLTRTVPVITDGQYSPEALWSFGRLGEMALSPDGNQVAYTVTWYDMKANRGWTDLHVMSVEDGESRQITNLYASCFNLVWNGNQSIRFISTHAGNSQIYQINADGTELLKQSSVAGGIDGFKISPDGARVLYTSRVKCVDGVADKYPDLPLATGQVYQDLMYRHWDSWDDGTRSHIFVARLSGGKVQEGIDIMAGQPYDSPLSPFGGMEEICWTPDGQQIAYTCKKLTGKEAAFSTNSDIYLYDLNDKSTKNLTASNLGYDRAPIFTSDGKFMLWLSMERAGFEADRERLMARNLQNGELREITKGFDYSVSSVQISPKNDSVYFVAGVQGTYQVYRKSLLGAEAPMPITEGQHDYQSIALAGGRLLGTRVSMVSPAEIYRISPADGEQIQLSHMNDELLKQLNMPKVTSRNITTTDGKEMLTWVVLPPNFDSTQSYPALLYCEGGPQSSLTQFWSYRWNLALMASQGYVVVAPNRRGTLTFGQEWTDAISKDHGGQEMRDLLCAIDELAKEPWVDSDRLGAVGASYGGYTVNWLAGHHQKRFKAFISHCGIFHSEMEFYTTEELFFDEWEMGGKPWDKTNRVAQNSFAQSPHHFVEKWDTPVMVIHGGRDFRIPYTQGMATFNAARMLGLDAKFLFFPDESHWVLKPQNGLLWQREFFDWLETYVKNR